MRSAHCLERFEQRLARYSDGVEQRLAFGALYLGEREQQVLGRDVFIAEILCLFLRAVENLSELTRKIRLRIALLGVARGLCFCLLTQ